MCSPSAPGSFLLVAQLCLCFVSPDQPGILCMQLLLPSREMVSKDLVLLFLLIIYLRAKFH